MKKRVLSLLLALLLVVSIFPVSVLAENTNCNGEHSGWNEIDSFEGLKNLFQDGGSGYLSGNITATDNLKVEGKSVSLCLNGKVLNLNEHHIEIGAQAEFTLCDCGSDTHVFDVGMMGNSPWKQSGSPMGDSIEFLSYPISSLSVEVNGGVITGGKNTDIETGGGAICISGFQASFTMNGGNIIGNTATSGGAVSIGKNSNGFTMNGGNIAGNTATSGGGVYVCKSFTMNGGNIIGNTAEYGGGVYSSEDQNNKINLNGGTIRCNSINGMDLRGGNITFSKNVIVTGNGASIDVQTNLLFRGSKVNYSIANPENGMSIGLTHCDDNAFISSNEDYTKYVSSDKPNYFVVFYDSSSKKIFLKEILTINNNTKETDKNTNNGYLTIDPQKVAEGMTVTVTVIPNVGYELETLTYNNSDISKDPTTGKYQFTMPNYDVYVEAQFKRVLINSWDTLQGKINDAPGTSDKPATEPTTIQLTQNLTALETNTSISIPEGKNIILDLNGEVLNANSRKFSVITVEKGGQLEIVDSAPTTEHNGYVDANLWHLGEPQNGETVKTIKGGVITGSTDSGIIVEGTLNMNNGSIAGNTTENSGGGVVVKGTFNMNGGTIENCTAPSSSGGVGMGGGVYVADDENYIFNINGGVIQDCFAQRWGGGVANQGTMTITKGAIQSCTANGAGGVNNDRIFTMYGGTIEKCKAVGEFETKFYSGGIRVANGKSNAKVMIGGDAKIINNTRIGDIASNLYLETGKTVTLGTKTASSEGNGVAAPTNDFSVGVTTATAPAVGVPVAITTNGASTDTDYFKPDSEDYKVNFNNDHLELKVANTVMIGDTGYATLAEALAAAQDGDTITLQKDNSEAITVNKAITFAVNASGKTFTVENITAGTGFERIMSTEDDVTTYKFRIPVTFDEEAKPVNGGNAITYGMTYEVTAPTVSNANGELDPQPEMTFTYYKSNEQNNWEVLNAKPTDAGNYKVVIAVKEDNSTYTGSKEYTYSIAKADVAVPTLYDAVIIDYANEKIMAKNNYKVSTTSGDSFATGVLNGETAIDFTKTYYFHKLEDNNHNVSSEGTYIPSRTLAPDIPVLDSKSDTTVTIIAVSNQEYSKDNGITWVSDGDAGDNDQTTGIITFAGFTANTAYSIITRSKSTNEKFASENSTALSGNTMKTEEGVPSVEALLVTEDSIIVTYNEKYEYSLDDGTWQSGEGKNRFTSLTAATKYTVKARIKGTEDTLPSEEKVLEIYTAHAKPTSGEGYEIDYGEEKITITSGYEISTKNGIEQGNTFEENKKSETVFGVKPEDTYYIRKAAISEGAPASGVSTLKIPARPAAPESTPKLDSKTDKTITIKALKGQEYSIDGGKNWVSDDDADGKITFSGLTEKTKYEIITRYKAVTTGDNRAFASENSKASTISTTGSENGKAKADPVDVIDGKINSGDNVVDVRKSDGEEISDDELQKIAEQINEVLDNDAVKEFDKENDDSGLIAATVDNDSAIVAALKATTTDPTAKNGVKETDISKYLNVKLVSTDVNVGKGEEGTITVTEMVFDVTPVATITVKGSDGEVTLTTEINNSDIEGKVKFLLPVDSLVEDEAAAIYHEGVFMGNHKIKKDANGNKYIEVETESFSKFGYILLNEDTAGAKIGDTLYITLSDALTEVKDGETIKLLKDSLDTLEVSRKITFTLEKNNHDAIIVAGNGYVLTINGNVYSIDKYKPENRGNKGNSGNSYMIGSSSKDAKSELDEENNPETGAPVINIGVAAILSLAFAFSKKH